jgi:hypothetical protein
MAMHDAGQLDDRRRYTPALATLEAQPIEPLRFFASLRLCVFARGSPVPQGKSKWHAGCRGVLVPGAEGGAWFDW